MENRFAYVGSYTNDVTEYKRYSKGKGLCVYQISEAGTWSRIQELADDNPCVLGFGKDQKVLYAANSPTFDKTVVGITCYNRDADTGKLKKCKQQFQLDIPICCFSVHPTYRYIIAADFKGYLYVISVKEDGSLDAVTDKRLLQGKLGPLTKIQKSPRPHSVNVSPNGRHIIVPDKGCDCVHSFELNLETGKLLEKGKVELRPAGCPRHLTFHPFLPYAYLVEEFSNEIVAFRYEDENGSLCPIQRIGTEPETFLELYGKASEIRVHPSGKYLYVSNRGHNSIAIYKIHTKNGMLERRGWKKCSGEIPRFFRFDSMGRQLICGNQKSHNIEIFNINQDTGELFTEKLITDVDCPVWILIV